MKNVNPTETISWKRLRRLFSSMRSAKIATLFGRDPDRFRNFSAVFDDRILVDYSKNHIDGDILDALVSLADECDIRSAVDSMFSGEKINRTEGRAALHTALRNQDTTPVRLDGQDVMPKIRTVLERMRKFCAQVIGGAWKGYTGKSITDVVSIGIGGSSLGPLTISEALKPYRNSLGVHFVSNLDGTHLSETLRGLDHETTMFLLISKSFTTQETVINANSARNWFLSQAGKRGHIRRHFVAASANPEEAVRFGIDRENVFESWDWVGGRYSLWSSMGLMIPLAVGFDNFEQLLLGAHAMDQHFRSAPLRCNLPVILALIGVWYVNFFRSESEAVLVYDRHMRRFAAYLQQLSMESNGKYIDRDGNKIVDYHTGPIVWGGCGTDDQHSFCQLIHQGTRMVPCDFIAPVTSHNYLADHHPKLLANFLAQTRALAFGGEPDPPGSADLSGSWDRFLPFRVCEGNRPTNSILLRKVDPYTLGILAAMYEHKVFTQGVILNVHTFDQWGVELGKQLAREIAEKLEDTSSPVVGYDHSTRALIDHCRSWR